MTAKCDLLGSVADIRIGYTFREKIKEVQPELGNARVVQIKDLRKHWDSSGSRLVSADNFPTIQWQGKTSLFVQPDCVLLPSRGEFLKAFYWPASNKEQELPVVVSSQLFFIRSISQKVLTEFIGWALNQTMAQQFFRVGSMGTSMPMLKKKNLIRLSLQIPSLNIQHKILHLNQIWEQEQQLTMAMLKNRQAMLQGMFQRLLKEDK